MMARCNTKAPVTAITILQRSAEAPPSLQPAKKSDVVRDMILRNFARQNPAIEIVDRFHQVVEQADCFILTYDTLDQAAELINDHFGIIPGKCAMNFSSENVNERNTREVCFVRNPEILR